MSALIARLTEFRRTGNAAVMTEAIPYCQFLGFSAELREGALIGTMRYSDHLVGNPALPALHGGTTGALLECTAIFQVLWQARTIVLPKTISITVQYLRSGRPLDTHACAVVTKHGRRVVAVRADAWQDDRNRLIATANAHFLIEAGS